LGGQNHPEHYHKKKDEIFHILHGNVYVKINGKEKYLTEGEWLRIPIGVLHSFRTDNYVIFEEVSNKIVKNDSYYTDWLINKNKNRKTKLFNWGMFQLD
jgi:uncharacterized cupin superfamily protein